MVGEVAETSEGFVSDAQNQHILASMVALFEAILINKMQHFHKIMPFLLILLPFYSVFRALSNGF